MLTDGSLVHLQRPKAIELLLEMARLWMLYDLQIIAARLHRSIYSPTEGLVEGSDAGAQSYQASTRAPRKIGEMAAIAERMLDPTPRTKTPKEKADEQRFWGFVNATGFKSMARDHGARMGLSPEDIDRTDANDFEHLRKIIVRARTFAATAVIMNEGIKYSLQSTWDDRAPTRKNEKPKAVSHLSAAALRYGMEGPAAMAHAIVAFIELSEQLPERIDQHLNGNLAALQATLIPTASIKRHNKVTFEQMFRAYRATILRDPNYLCGIDTALLPRTKAGNHDRKFNTNSAATNWRRDYTLGRTSSAAVRLGEAPLDPTAPLLPGKPSNYGKLSLSKALAVTKRNRNDKQPAFDPIFTPAILWRFSSPPGVTSRTNARESDKSIDGPLGGRRIEVRMASQNRIVRFPEILLLTGLSRASIYRKMAAGTFPPRHKFCGSAIGWKQPDIMAWLADPR